VKISVSAALLSPASTPGLAVSKAAKAVSFGANTVNGPGPFRTSIKPALVNAAASLVKLPAATAVSTMSLSSLSPPPVPPAPAAAPAAPAAAPAAPAAAPAAPALFAPPAAGAPAVGAPPLEPPLFPAEATLPALPPSASLSLPQPATDKLANSIADSQGKYFMFASPRSRRLRCGRMSCAGVAHILGRTCLRSLGDEGSQRIRMNTDQRITAARSLAVSESQRDVVDLAIAVCVSVQRDASREIALELRQERQIVVGGNADRAVDAGRSRPVEVSEPLRHIEGDQRARLFCGDCKAVIVCAQTHARRRRAQQCERSSVRKLACEHDRMPFQVGGHIALDRAGGGELER